MAIVQIISTPTHRSLVKRSKRELVDMIVTMRRQLGLPSLSDTEQRALRMDKFARELASEVLNLMRQFPED